MSSRNNVDYSSRMPHMWADTLQAAERALWLRTLAWGAASMFAGTVLLAWLTIGARQSRLVQQFATQSIGWGAIEVSLAAGFLSRLAPRDLAGATRLDRLLWLNIGLDGGYLLAGVVLIGTGWRLGRRLGLIGAGMGVVVQACALALLDLMLAAQISR